MLGIFDDKTSLRVFVIQVVLGNLSIRIGIHFDRCHVKRHFFDIDDRFSVNADILQRVFLFGTGPHTASGTQNENEER